MRWARIEEHDGKHIVIELTNLDPAGRFHPSLVWVEVEVSDGAKERDEYLPSGETSPPPPPTYEVVCQAIREQRDRLLTETDWTQGADIPQATKDKWAPYRQALRDVPDQSGFPFDVVWPVKP